MSKAEINLRHEASFGNTPTTLSPTDLFVDSLQAVGRPDRSPVFQREIKNRNPSARFSSSHADNRGAETAYFWMAVWSNSSASCGLKH